MDRFRKAFVEKILFSALICNLIILGCRSEKTEISTVSVGDFSKFIAATGYITDAERYGWSVVQKNVFEFEVDSSATWKIPNGVDSCRHLHPVTQVSFNDAQAYAQWNHSRLPSYKEYWDLVRNDSRPINQNSQIIFPLDQVNIVGNVWEITTSENKTSEIRLAGGSFLCSPNSCDGTNPSRQLFVDKETGNSHIGFAVIKKK